jgi:tetratricopeptide (TPR) repeat protein
MITELSAVDLKVKMELMAESGLEDQRRLNWIVDSLFEVKRLVSAKRYDDAIELLKKVKEAVPQVSAVYELEGGIYFIQNKLHAALDSYTMSVRYNPKNMESIRMKEFVEQKIKGSR